MADIVDVAVPIGVRQSFSYSVPACLRSRILPGCRVLVPFGRKLVTGIVVSSRQDAPQGVKLRQIRELIDPAPILPQDIITTALWVAEHYFTAPGEVLRALFPSGSECSGREQVRLSPKTEGLLSGGLRPVGLSPQENSLLEVLRRDGPASLKELRDRSGLRDTNQWVEALEQGKWIERVHQIVRGRVREKAQLGIRRLNADTGVVETLAPAQRRFWEFLQQGDSALPLEEVLRRSGSSASVARSLAGKGLAEIAPLKIERTPLDLAETPSKRILTLTEVQARVFNALCEMLKNKKAVRCLLHGVTGSGKTEIYLRLIAEVLSEGGTAMLLVPEIGLTTLLSRIAISHFPEKVALLHSGMSSGERFDQWNRIRAGQAPVVVGTRSAVFAPLENLRLIVIDEEQDSSYKQDETPCYHAREVAWHRVRHEQGVLLLGSATPSIETFHSATAAGETSYLCLPERIASRPLPDVTIVDMSIEFQRHGRKAILAQTLVRELSARVEHGEQAIVLLNRRGYSRSLLCRGCGTASFCPDCSVSLTYHQDRQLLMCHYCGRETSVPTACAICGGEYITFVGVGTEQLEEILRTLLPKARLARLDRDTTRRRGTLRKTLLDFSARKLDILVGTQMLAKGHDFPNVTLVGVIAADAGLQFPDFRSAERTFQLLTQVAGRAGRGQAPGRVVIQSFYPDHYALAFARKQDYEGFYGKEIEFRKLMGYPPFTQLVQILASESSYTKAMQICEKIATALKQAVAEQGVQGSLHILGPAAAPLEKLRGRYRVQLLLKAFPGVEPTAVMREAFRRLGEHRVPLKNVHVDVDPLSLL